MPPEQAIQIQVDRPAARLDRFLAEAMPHLSRSQIQKLIRQGQVCLSTSPNRESCQITRPGAGVQPGQVITLHLPPAPEKDLQPELMPLDIVFEDDDLVVLNKPAGLVVHPAHGHAAGTLVNALLARYPDLAGLREADAGVRPGLVHRLDRDTSGLMIVARTPQALQHLRRQFKTRAVEKTYLALVFGRPEAPAGVIDVPLGRDPRHRQKFAPRPGGKPARTHYRLREDFGRYSLLEVGLETGRTHQIRVHLAWLKCPVVGDPVYGRQKNALGLKRQFLHAWRLRFEHPRRGTMLQLEAPLPGDLQAALAGLR
ncbi:MAG: RluA family pseudouridine synthase [Anaerolineae bacterium]|nr:RluA family pseudouridine synthase [Anaerolineae bacterium]